MPRRADPCRLPPWTKSKEAVAKARRWLVPLVASMAWFWDLVRERVAGLTTEAGRAFRERLLPGLYWQREARRGRDREQCQQRQTLSARLLAAAWSPEGVLGRLPVAQRAELMQVAEAAVSLFVRSSSCVEGRNGRLSLYHHGQGPLSDVRLRALTAVHNYVVERSDGTTAAERFFGVKPRAVFECLLEGMRELPRPAQKRSSAPEEATIEEEQWPNPGSQPEYTTIQLTNPALREVVWVTFSGQHSISPAFPS